MRRGVILVLILIGLAVMVSAAGMMVLAMMAPPPVTVPQNSTLYLPLKAPFAEVEPADVFSQLVRRDPTLREVLASIDKAKRDARVKTLVFTPATAGALWAQVQDVRNALLDFKTSGKALTAYLELGTTQDYYLASVADRIVMMPAGQLDLTGVATYEIFLRGTLEKLGVQPDLLHIGEYKTAANTMTERGFTRAHREMSESLNRDWYEELVRGIAEGRKKSVEEIRAAIDGGPYLPEAALKIGLIDAVQYEDQLDDEGPGKGTRRLEDEDYRRATVPPPPRNENARIALLYAVGTIESGQSPNEGTGGVIGSQTFVEWLRKVRLDSSVRAVVVRIDSPGGSAIASEVIWREMMLTREAKPLIVSMGDVAASGGYYMAVPAHTIVAQPGTLTGSIGVVTGKFVLDGTMDKIGVGTDAVSDGKNARIYSPFRPFTPEERARIEEQMQHTYNLFLSRVAEGRKSEPEKIDAVAQGRVWTGLQAQQRGLVDEIGSLQRAIDIAKERARLDVTKTVDLLVYPQKPSVFEMLANPLGTSVTSGASALGVLLGRPEAHVVEQHLPAMFRFKPGEMLALMPNIFLR